MYSFTVTFSAFEITKLSFAMLEEMDKFFLAKTNYEFIWLEIAVKKSPEASVVNTFIHKGIYFKR